MTDREALYAAILAAPDDDLARLVFADWLEENNERERAVHLRAQVELAKLVAAGAFDADDYLDAVQVVASVASAELWESVARDGLPIGNASTFLTRDTVVDTDWLRDVYALLALGQRRGVVERVRCRAAFWVESGPTTAAKAPLRRVEFSDRQPFRHMPGEWVWTLPGGGAPGGFGASLPVCIFERLAGAQGFVAVYTSRAAAEDALSDACLVFARGSAG